MLPTFKHTTLFAMAVLFCVGCASSPPKDASSPSGGQSETASSTQAGANGDAPAANVNRSGKKPVVDSLTVTAGDGKIYKVVCDPPGDAAVAQVFRDGKSIGQVAWGPGGEEYSNVDGVDFLDIIKRFESAGGYCMDEGQKWRVDHGLSR